MTINFGKHKGSYISDLPTEYLEWLLGNVPLYPHLKNAVVAELHKRSRPKQQPTPQVNPLTVFTPIYKTLAKKYHPDKGGSTVAMQALNEFYAELKRIVL